MVIEKSEKSESPVRISKPHFNVFPEFNNTSYLDRYEILCKKLMLERHYTSASLVWTSYDKSFGNVSDDLSIDRFLLSFMGYVQGNLNDFE